MNKRYTSHALFIHLAIGLALCLALLVPSAVHAEEQAVAEAEDSWYLDYGTGMGYLGYKGGWTEGKWGYGLFAAYTLGVRVDWWGLYLGFRLGDASLERLELREDLSSENMLGPLALGFSIGPRFFWDYGQLKLWGQVSFALGNYGYDTIGSELSVGFTYYFRQLARIFGFYLGLELTYYVGASKYWSHQKAKMVWGATSHIMVNPKLGIYF
ncbi:MAG: hypothetical protein FWC40_04220 [Proteobacteria bacterium]|nr:hypothetical protein [Pseudomonadota bacterium]MCL2325687.1 hypothetical protein [Pseudomonadota bacterium]